MASEHTECMILWATWGSWQYSWGDRWCKNNNTHWVYKCTLYYALCL